MRTISGWFRDIYCQLVQRIQLNFPRRAEACTFFRIFFVVTLLLRDGLDSYSVQRHAKVRFFLAHKHAASALFSINGLLLSWLRTRFSRRWAGSSAARIQDYLRRTEEGARGTFYFHMECDGLLFQMEFDFVVLESWKGVFVCLSNVSHAILVCTHSVLFFCRLFHRKDEL